MKKYRVIMLILILLLCISIFLLLGFVKKNKDSYTETKSITTEENRKIYPEGAYQLSYKYKGSTDLNIFYSKLYRCIHYINKLNGRDIVNKEQIEKYFSENKSEIKSELGIVNIDDFKNLINISKKIYKYTKYQTIKLDMNTYKIEGEFAILNMEVVYSENDVLKFKVYIGNTVKQKGIIKFIPIVEE